jgi:hypothetical protein
MCAPVTSSSVMRFLLVCSLFSAGLFACADDETEEGRTTQPDTSVDTGSDSSDPDAGGSDTGDAGEGDGISGDTDADPRPEEPDWCQGATAHLWDPVAATELEFFPDGTLVRADDTTPTGLRLDISAETAPWYDSTPDLLKESFAGFNDLSGFGTMGAALLRFSAPVVGLPETADESLTNTAYQWYDMGADPPERIPFEVRVLEEGQAVVLWPLRPLRAATEHAVVVTTDARAADGECISPSAATRSLLFGDEPVSERIGRFAPAWRETAERLGFEPQEITAMTVFTTHNDFLILRDLNEAAADDAAEWLEPGDCIEEGQTLQCEGRTTILDYRGENGLVDPNIEPVEGEIPVTYWLPREGEGPFPLLVYGHGLNSERDEGYEIARRVASIGMAVISMEAAEHGEHPSVSEAERNGGALELPALRFLGIDLTNLKIRSRQIRGNIDQTNLDRLRLMRLLRSDGDINGDGVPEFDTSRIAYIGASLGAICGAELLALSPDIDAGALVIGGGRLISIVTDMEMLASYRPLLDSLIGDPRLFDRLMPVGQHLVDASDPASWAPFIIHERLDGRTPPSIMMVVGTSDEIVPPSAGRNYARSIDIPHLAPVVQPVGLIDVIEEGPVVGNFSDGTRTAAFFQLDRVTRNGEVQVAGHVETAKSDETAAMVRQFFGDWAAGEVPQISDPYLELGTPALPGE